MTIQSVEVRGMSFPLTGHSIRSGCRRERNYTIASAARAPTRMRVRRLESEQIIEDVAADRTLTGREGAWDSASGPSQFPFEAIF